MVGELIAAATAPDASVPAHTILLCHFRPIRVQAVTALSGELLNPYKAFLTLSECLIHQIDKLPAALRQFHPLLPVETLKARITGSFPFITGIILSDEAPEINGSLRRSVRCHAVYRLPRVLRYLVPFQPAVYISAPFAKIMNPRPELRNPFVIYPVI